MEKNAITTFFGIRHSIVVLFVVGKVMLKRNNGHHQIKAILGGAKVHSCEYFENNQLIYIKCDGIRKSCAQHQYALTFAGQT